MLENEVLGGEIEEIRMCSFVTMARWPKDPSSRIEEETFFFWILKADNYPVAKTVLSTKWFSVPKSE